MIDLELDSTNDLVIENYDLALLTEANQVAQNIQIKLQMFQGEWFLDITAGLPYYESILVKNPDGAEIDAIIKSEILAVEGVNELLEYSAEFDENNPRWLNVTFTVDTDFGVTSGSA